MPSVLECVSETQTNRVWPAGFGVSYGIGSTLKQTQRSRNSYKVKTLTSIISDINTHLSPQKHAHTHTHPLTHTMLCNNTAKNPGGTTVLLKNLPGKKGRLKYTQDMATF